MTSLPPDDDAVVARTTESSAGEISCSVEETNRIRKLLGLKPLRIESSASSFSTHTSGKRREDDLRRRLLQSKRKRVSLDDRGERSSRKRRTSQDDDDDDGSFSGQSIASELRTSRRRDGESNVAEWIEKSRKRMSTAMQRETAQSSSAPARAVADAASSSSVYDARALKGIQVAHEYDEFEAGTTTVLTLKDRGVLDEGDDGVVLENVNLVGARRTEASRRRKRKSKPSFRDDDDNDFGRLAAARNDVGARILQKYDEEDRERERLNRVGMVLSGDAVVSADRIKEAEEVKRRMDALKGAREGETMVDISGGTKIRVVDDYLTAEETSAAATFKRSKKKKKKKRKKKTKHPRRPIETVAPENETTPTSGNLADELEATPQVVDGERVDLNVPERARKLAKRLERSRRRAAAVLEGRVDAIGAGDDDVLPPPLVATSTRRKTAAERVAERLKRSVAAPRTDTSTSEDGARIVFTSTTEFTHRLKAEMDADTSAAVSRREKTGAPSSSRRATVVSHEISSAPSTTSSEPPPPPPPAFDSSEPLVGSGLAATLSLLDRTGDLRSRAVVAGRANDETILVDSASDRVKLERRDKWGRVLSQKEAFRQLSYKFHGQKPGRKKQERMLKKLQDDLKITSMKQNDTPLGVVGATYRTQARKGQAHVVLSGGGRTRRRE